MLRNRLSKVKIIIRIIIINEISMVSRMLLCPVNEILGCSDHLRFPEISVIVCGDFYQFHPVRGPPAYISTSSKTKFANFRFMAQFMR